MALAKNNSITILDRVIKDPLATRAATSQGIQTSKMHTIAVAGVAWHTYTKTVEKAFAKGKELVASYMKGMFRIIKKVDDNISAAGYYHIPESNIKAPKITNHGLLTTWGEYITVGETDRVAGGGTAMANPTAGNVGTGIGDFNAKILVHSGLKEAVVTASCDLATHNAETDKVIKKVWDTLKTNFDEGTQSAQNDHLRQYGVVFLSDIKKIFNVLVLNNATGLPIRPSIELVETGLTRTAGTDGRAAMPSTITHEATFLATLAGFTPAQVVVAVDEAILVYTVTIRLNPLP